VQKFGSSKGISSLKLMGETTENKKKEKKKKKNPGPKSGAKTKTAYTKQSKQTVINKQSKQLQQPP
jgi:hypothetical protein